jgi:hypothetical protein
VCAARWARCARERGASQVGSCRAGGREERTSGETRAPREVTSMLKRSLKSSSVNALSTPHTMKELALL